MSGKGWYINHMYYISLFLKFDNQCLPLRLLCFADHSTASMFTLSYLFYLLVRFVMEVLSPMLIYYQLSHSLSVCMMAQTTDLYHKTHKSVWDNHIPLFYLSLLHSPLQPPWSSQRVGGGRRTQSPSQSRHRWMKHLSSPLSLSTESHTPYQSTFTGFMMLMKLESSHFPML